MFWLEFYFCHPSLLVGSFALWISASIQPLTLLLLHEQLGLWEILKTLKQHRFKAVPLAVFGLFLLVWQPRMLDFCGGFSKTSNSMRFSDVPLKALVKNKSRKKWYPNNVNAFSLFWKFRHECFSLSITYNMTAALTSTELFTVTKVFHWEQSVSRPNRHGESI